MKRSRLVTTMLASSGPSDTTAPTVAITSTQTSPTLAATIPLTITFSEVVTGFAVGDITVVGCTLAGFATVDNKVFTVTATATANAVTVDIAAGVCTDLAGNANLAATQFAITSLYFGLVAWYDFSDLTTLFQDTARTTPVTADGQAIAGVIDKSAGAKHLTAAATEEPLYKANIKNGLSVARFDNSNDGLTLASLALSTAHTSFAVIIPRGAFSMEILAGGTSGNYIPFLDGTNMYYYAGGQGVQNAHGGMSNGTAYLLEIVRNGTTVQLFKNAAQLGGDKTLAANNNLTITKVGTYASAGGTLNGDMGCLMIYNTNLSVTLRQAIESYLNTKWALGF